MFLLHCKPLASAASMPHLHTPRPCRREDLASLPDQLNSARSTEERLK